MSSPVHAAFLVLEAFLGKRPKRIVLRLTPIVKVWVQQMML
jgi:hypothetical protein